MRPREVIDKIKEIEKIDSNSERILVKLHNWLIDLDNSERDMCIKSFEEQIRRQAEVLEMLYREKHTAEGQYENKNRL